MESWRGEAGSRQFLSAKFVLFNVVLDLYCVLLGFIVINIDSTLA